MVRFGSAAIPCGVCAIGNEALARTGLCCLKPTQTGLLIGVGGFLTAMEALPKCAATAPVVLRSLCGISLGRRPEFLLRLWRGLFGRPSPTVYGNSNFKDCSLPPEEYKLEDLENMADNLLPNRKPLNLLFEAMLILGLDLHSPIQTQTIQNKQVFLVADNQAIACFEEGLTEEFAKALADYKPRRVVLLDSGFASDAIRINIEQLFQQLSPATHITIL